MTEYKEINTTHHDSGQAGRATTFKVTQLIWLFLGILEVVLGLRFIFKLIGVNAQNLFATFLYNLTGIFVAPFASLTGAPASGGMVFEFSTILAMIVYALLGWMLERLVYVIFYKPRSTAVSTRQTTVAEQTPDLSVRESVSTRQTTVAEQVPDLSLRESQTTTTTTENDRIL